MSISESISLFILQHVIQPYLPEHIIIYNVSTNKSEDIPSKLQFDDILEKTLFSC